MTKGRLELIEQVAAILRMEHNGGRHSIGMAHRGFQGDVGPDAVSHERGTLDVSLIEYRDHIGDPWRRFDPGGRYTS